MEKNFDYQKVIDIIKETIEIEIESINNLLKNINEDFAKAVELMYNCKGKIIISGMGKSGLIGKKIAATLTSTGTKAIFLHPGEGIHGDLGIVDKNDVILLISKSGENPELRDLIPFFKLNNNKIISITANINSFLAKNSLITLNGSIIKEACPNNLVPTTSTTVALIIGDALAVALLSLKNFSKEDFARFHPGGSLGKRLLLQVNTLMHTKDLPINKENDDIMKILMTMSAGRLGVTVILDEVDNKILGIITDGDLRRMLEKGININTLTASDIMTKNPKTINEDELAIKALAKMEKYSITSLVVIDKNNSFKGILHIHDILNVGITLE